MQKKNIYSRQSVHHIHHIYQNAELGHLQKDIIDSYSLTYKALLNYLLQGNLMTTRRLLGEKLFGRHGADSAPPLKDISQKLLAFDGIKVTQENDEIDVQETELTLEKDDDILSVARSISASYQHPFRDLHHLVFTGYKGKKMTFSYHFKAIPMVSFKMATLDDSISEISDFIASSIKKHEEGRNKSASCKGSYVLSDKHELIADEGTVACAEMVQTHWPQPNDFAPFYEMM